MNDWQHKSWGHNHINRALGPTFLKQINIHLIGCSVLGYYKRILNSFYHNILYESNEWMNKWMYDLTACVKETLIRCLKVLIVSDNAGAQLTTSGYEPTTLSVTRAAYLQQSQRRWSLFCLFQHFSCLIWCTCKFYIGYTCMPQVTCSYHPYWCEFFSFDLSK